MGKRENYHRPTLDERERRLDAVEDLMAQGATSRDIIKWAQSPAKPGEPPRWPSAEGNRPMDPLTDAAIRRYIAEARERIRRRPRPDRDENLRLSLLGSQRLYKAACQAGDLGAAASALRFKAELDGSHLAAEEASRPTLWQEVMALVDRVRDFDPDAPLAGCAELPGDLDAALRRDPAVVQVWRAAIRPALDKALGICNP